jgi:general secretion pathway protein F
MPAFQYYALTAKGEKQKSLIEADSAKQARQLLREKNLTVLDIHPVQQKSSLTHLKH